MSRLPIALLLCLTSLAASPATRPAPPQTDGPADPPPLIDPHRPAFVPAFAKANNPPAGRSAERQHAYFYGTPGPYLYGYGGYGHYGWAYGYSGVGYGGVFSVYGGW